MDEERIDRTVPLREQLDRFPSLRAALGRHWVDREESTDPIASRYAITRWLRREGFSEGLAVLDGILADFSDVAGIAARRTRLRSDPAGIYETVTELKFGAWLRSKGWGFRWPDAGPDFSIDLEDGDILSIEVTTPRRAIWMQDLFERLHLVALRFGVEVNIRHETELLSDVPDPLALVVQIVTELVEALRSGRTGAARHRRHRVHMAYPDLQLDIRTKPTDDPRIVQTASPGPTSHHWGFNLMVEVALKKRDQMAGFEPAALLIGTSQLPTLTWRHFTDALRYYREEDLEFDWKRLPPETKYVILYGSTLKQLDPHEGFFLVNPASPVSDPTGIERFMDSFFPAPIRAESG